MASSITNIKIQPQNVYWQDYHSVLVETVADSASSLNNKYFVVSSPTVNYYVWLNVGGAGVDPTPASLTALTSVAISANATAAAVATAIQTAVDADANWQATVSGDEVTITSVAIGERLSVPGAGDSGFTVSEITVGGDIYLGLLDGDVETSFEEQVYQVNAHQYGSTVLAEIQTGVGASVSLTLKESDTEKLKEIFGKAAGGTHTPSGGTELFGFGTSNQGDNTFSKARRLVLKPVGAGDNLGNLTFWKAYPMPNSLVFSGENPKTLSVEFKVYRDPSKNEAISYFAFGDQTQLNPA